jgi:hypothetical protein
MSVLATVAVACGSDPIPRRTAPTTDAGQGGEAGATDEPSSGGERPSGGAEPTADAGAAGAPDLDVRFVVRELSVIQTVEVPLVVDGEPVPLEERSAPLVAGKEALFRAQVDLMAGFASRKLLGVLELDSGERSQAFLSERIVSVSSDKDKLATSFVFHVGPRDFGPDTRYRLRILEADATHQLLALPESGLLELGAQRLAPFQLVLVPVTVNGFVPPLGELELAALRARFTTLYPSAAVDISLSPGFSVEYPFNADGDGWEEALSELLAFRQAAKPARNVFYYGALAPAESYGDYCSNSCILGLSNVTTPGSVYERGSIGVTVFPDGSGARDAWDTLLHELGHALGREHADCGNPDYPDQEYPYANASMGGVYGYDLGAMQLIKPRGYRDVMSYCRPQWISDYTYSGIFERLASIDSEALRVLSFAPTETLRVARIDRHGRASWRGERREPFVAEGVQSFPLLDAAGRRIGVVPGRVTRLDHLPGGAVWFRSGELSVPGAAAVDLSSVTGSAGAGTLPL